VRRSIVGLTLLLAACGTPAVGGSTDLTDGRELFASPVLGNRAGCITCHSLEPDVTLVGPSMAGVGGRADDRVEALDATSYLRQSIVEPNAYVVDGFDDDVMPGDYVLSLNDQQIEALVDYMEGLK
jgi:cytochrome c551/c552